MRRLTTTTLTALVLLAGFEATTARAAGDVLMAQGPAAMVAHPQAHERLEAALAASDARDEARARALAERLPPVERRLVEWMLIRRDAPGLTSREITRFAAAAPDWPTASIMRRRAEAALAREGATPAEIVKAFGATAPETGIGLGTLITAHIALDDRAAAAKVAGHWWRTQKLTPADEAEFFQRYGDLLSRDDEIGRFHLMMFGDRMSQARSVAQRLGPGWTALADARAAVLRGEAGAAKQLEKVPAELRADPLYGFTTVEYLRRQGHPDQAAKLLRDLTAAGRTRGDADEWWIERRIVSRDLNETGDAALAYELAAQQQDGGPITRVEAEFHAGWYALRFLKDPAIARRHFDELARISTRPISRSRAAYWQARAAEAAGDEAEARGFYESAARDVTTFYGQLARRALGHADLGLPAAPEPTEADRAAFAADDMVRAALLLTELGRAGDADLLYPAIARRLATPGQVALLAEFLERQQRAGTILQVAKIAMERFPDVASLAYPLDSIPVEGRSGEMVEPAMVYAIARQESAFDTAAVSSAGALGLLQMMPGTAEMTARKLGVAWSRPRLTSDPAYNATLGAAHLKDLVDDFSGSYILSFAAYNAGPGKVREWVRRFGDPRSGTIDPIDWIELIPYGETRNYVQRVAENLAVYRTRLTGADLQIEDDLRRGVN